MTTPPGTVRSVRAFRVAAAALLIAGAAVSGADEAPAVAPVEVIAMPAGSQPSAAQPVETLYVCPMHPEVVRERPGRCPICGMDLVAKAPGGVHSHPPMAIPEHAGAHPEERPDADVAITVSDRMINQLGVRSAPVRRGTLERHVEGFGVFMRSTVQGYRPVYHGPDPSAAAGAASTSALLVQGQVFERQAPLLREGQRVWVRVPALGARAWEGRLIGFEAQINQATHTQVFHVSVAPEAASIPPGMNANLVVEVEPVSDALLVPREAVILTGRGARVIVALEGGRFAQRKVAVEDTGESEVVIHSGLQEGERVVVSGQFLLDSEASLQAGLKRLAGEAPEPAGDAP